jgi:hypothetical protein
MIDSLSIETIFEIVSRRQDYFVASCRKWCSSPLLNPDPVLAIDLPLYVAGAPTADVSPT